MLLDKRYDALTRIQNNTPTPVLKNNMFSEKKKSGGS
jgi:hypothetical protein